MYFMPSGTPYLNGHTALSLGLSYELVLKELSVTALGRSLVSALHWGDH